MSEDLRKPSGALAVDRDQARDEPIVCSQQSLAPGAPLIETFDLIELTEESLRINTTRITDLPIEIERAFEPLPPVSAA